MQGRAASEVKHRRRRSTETKAKRATRDANASAIMAAMAEAARLAAAKARAGVGSPQPTAEPRAPCGDGSAWELSRIAAGANLSCSSTSSSRLWQRQLRTRDGPQHPAAGRTRLHADWRGNRSVAGCGTPSGGGAHTRLCPGDAHYASMFTARSHGAAKRCSLAGTRPGHCMTALPTKGVELHSAKSDKPSLERRAVALHPMPKRTGRNVEAHGRTGAAEHPTGWPLGPSAAPGGG